MVVYKSQNSRYRKDLLFLDAADRLTKRSGVAARIEFMEVKVEVIGAGTARS